MEGEDEESTDERAFCRKKPWQRFIIVVAGAVFNLLLGVILVAISLAPGELLGTTTVAKFTEAYVTPFTDKAAFSTRFTQAAQEIPVI